MPPRPYKEITKSLTILAFWGGNYAAALKEIRADGTPLAQETLKGWATGKYSEDYEQIKENFRQTFQEEIVSQMREVIRKSTQAELDAIQQALDNIKAEPGKNAAQAAYYLSQVKKNNVEKLQSMTGQPTHIIEDRTPDAALRSLIQRGIIRPAEAKVTPELRVIEGGEES